MIYETITGGLVGSSVMSIDLISRLTARVKALEGIEQKTETVEITREAKGMYKALESAGLLHDTNSKPYRVATIAARYKWDILDIQPQTTLLRFTRLYKGKPEKINVYYGGIRMPRNLFTVVTEVEHPRLGSTHLVRKHVTEGELEAILNNPRVHTNKGRLI